MGILTMPLKGKGWIIRLFGVEARFQSARQAVDDAYARRNGHFSPELKQAHKEYKAAQEARERKNRSN